MPFFRVRLSAGSLLLLLSAAFAYAGVWNPGSDFKQVSIWPHGAPNGVKSSAAESANLSKKLLAGKPVTAVLNVKDPTMTVYPAKGKNTGAAVVVFPGGGYQILAVDLEGTEVCDWLTSIGITCVLLKYRVPYSGPYWNPKLKREVMPKVFTALQDAQRTLGLVRMNTAQWKIDPKKIGVIGFSAGGHLVAAISTNYKKRIYPPVDEADKVSCRPDFAMAIYPGHMSALNDLSRLNPGLPFTHETPPTFIVQAENDPVDPVQYSLLYFEALRKAKVPAEMHLYAEGGHAFALRRTGLPITHWTDLAETWMRTIGVLPKK